MSPGFGLKQPCPGCPFGRHEEAVLHLGEARIREIAESDGDFVCHRTLPSTANVKPGNEQVCAGWLIYQLENGCGKMTRIAGRLGMFDPEELMKSADHVVTDWEELADRHSSRRRA